MGYGQGDQILSLAYDDNATTSNFNKKLYKILKPGIVWGGTLTNPSGHNIEISNFILLYECSTGELVRVQTNLAVTVVVSEAEPWIVYNLSWTNDLTNYGIYRKDSDDGNFNGNNIYSNEIVFGKATYAGGVITGVEYNDKTWGLIDTTGNLHVPGVINVENQQVIGSQLSTISDPVSVSNDITDSSGGTPDASHIIQAGTNTNSLTDSTTGTADDTLSAISGSGADSDINNNFKELADQLAIQRSLNIILLNALSTIATEYNLLKDDAEGNNAAIDTLIDRLKTHGLIA